jgi:hypothetical protein
VRSALSVREDAADESDILEAWISLGCVCLPRNYFVFKFDQEDLPTKQEASRLPNLVEFFLNLNSLWISAKRCAL